jgi:hypothetical protein
LKRNARLLSAIEIDDTGYTIGFPTDGLINSLVFPMEEKGRAQQPPVRARDQKKVPHEQGRRGREARSEIGG